MADRIQDEKTPQEPRESFVIYHSMREAADCLPDDSARMRFWNFIFDFGFLGKIPEKEKTPEYALFIASYKPVEKAKNRYDACVENGKKGGRPRKEENREIDPEDEIPTAKGFKK